MPGTGGECYLAAARQADALIWGRKATGSCLLTGFFLLGRCKTEQHLGVVAAAQCWAGSAPAQGLVLRTGKRTAEMQVSIKDSAPKPELSVPPSLVMPLTPATVSTGCPGECFL